MQKTMKIITTVAVVLAIAVIAGLSAPKASAASMALTCYNGGKTTLKNIPSNAHVFTFTWWWRYNGSSGTVGSGFWYDRSYVNNGVLWVYTGAAHSYQARATVKWNDGSTSYVYGSCS